MSSVMSSAMSSAAWRGPRDEPSVSFPVTRPRPRCRDRCVWQNGLPRCPDLAVEAVEDALTKHMARIEKRLASEGQPLSPSQSPPTPLATSMPPPDQQPMGRDGDGHSPPPHSPGRKMSLDEIFADEDDGEDRRVSDGALLADRRVSLAGSEGGEPTADPSLEVRLSNTVHGALGFICQFQGGFLRGLRAEAWEKVTLQILEACQRHAAPSPTAKPPSGAGEPHASARANQKWTTLRIVSSAARVTRMASLGGVPRPPPEVRFGPIAEDTKGHELALLDSRQLSARREGERDKEAV